MMFTLSKESKNPNTEENLVIHVMFIRQNMFTIKTISWASQITTHRSSHCYVTKKILHTQVNTSSLKEVNCR